MIRETTLTRDIKNGKYEMSGFLCNTLYVFHYTLSFMTQCKSLARIKGPWGHSMIQPVQVYNNKNLKKNKFKNGLSQQPLSGFHLEFKNFQGLEIKKTPPEV